MGVIALIVALCIMVGLLGIAAVAAWGLYTGHLTWT